MTFALIAGGGTAGHVVPALAVARELVERGHDPATIRFAGSRRGMEAEMVPAAGFPIDLLPGRGINERKLSFSNLASAAALAAAAVSGLTLMARHRPSVVLSVGGYASLAPALAAGLLRRPLILHEQNARPGAANRMVARFAAASAVSLEGTPLPRPVLTGNPVASPFTGLRRNPESVASARKRLGIPAGRTVVAAWGGSLGSRRINEAVRDLAALWSDRADVHIQHVIGRRDHPNWEDPAAGSLSYSSVEYEDSMADLMLAADIGVCRAGGMTVAELALAGLPAVLIPLPIATEDHQTANARSLVDAGGAFLVPDGECSASRLDALLRPLLDDPGSRNGMSTALAGLARPDAASRVADLLEEHAR